MNTTDYIFEVSWEVCNKVGGIYTVVKSKAALIKEHYPNYFLVGPYFKDQAETEFIPEPHPHGFGEIFDQLKSIGITCYFGRWQVKGEPYVILVELTGFSQEHDNIKSWLWNNYGIDSLNAGQDFDEPTVWSFAVGKLIELFIRKKIERSEKGLRYLVQAHEWLCASTILYLKKSSVPVATVFTTHATMLGRSLAGSGRNLYDELEHIDPDNEAKQMGIQAKHLTEKSCAHVSDIFTTVSEITGLEAEHLLGKKPDVLVLNGLDFDRMPTYEETAYQHRKNRSKIHEFLRYYFLPYYYFDIKDTSLFFIVGRYEFKNKGVDILIDALSKLNQRMKKEKSGHTVICFFWIPRDVRGVKTEISINKTAYTTLQSFLDDNIDKIRTEIVSNIIRSGIQSSTPDDFGKDIFDQEFIQKIKRLKINFSKKGNPPFSTHNIPDEYNDTIIQSFMQKGLNNGPDDPVKVIFYPIYLTGVDGLTDLDYYSTMNACHLGIFPSYYEPWGYTPLECGALGVPSITSDLSGFGRFLLKKTTGTSGIFVLNRYKRNPEDVLNDFTDMLHTFTKFNLKERVQQKILAKELANLADWNTLIYNYYDAYKKAFENVFGRG